MNVTIATRLLPGTYQVARSLFNSFHIAYVGVIFCPPTDLDIYFHACPGNGRTRFTANGISTKMGLCRVQRWEGLGRCEGSGASRTETHAQKKNRHTLFTVHFG